MPGTLPEQFARWFASRGWTPRAHQLELLAKARAGHSVLLIAPTGGGKTLAGFLPSLVELSEATGCRTLRERDRKEVDLARPWRAPGGRPAYALHIAAEGARRRYCAQSRTAARRNEFADPYRDADRRHAGLEAPAPAPRSAGDLADHAGAGRAAARLCRRPVSVRLAQARHPRRAARTRHLEARRSVVVGAGAAVSSGARPHQHRSFGDGCRAGRPLPFHGAATGRRGAAPI